MFQLLQHCRKDSRIALLAILLDNGQLELMFSVGLVGACNKRFRETLCLNTAKLLLES